MVWAKLDDDMLDNPKVARAGVLGFAVHVAGIIHCCRNLTDGYIPQARVACLLDLSAVNMSVHDASPDPELPAVDALGVADWLVECGLWEKAPGGYRIHDFLDFNPSREKVLAERQRGADRAKASHDARKASKASPDLRPKTRRRVTEAPVDLRPVFGSSSDGPDPDPDPVPEDPREGDRAGAQADQPLAEGTAAADAVIGDYEQAVSAVTGSVFALDYRSGDRGRLVRLAAAYCKGKPVAEIRQWVRESVDEWARPRVDEPDFASGFAPRGFETWLRGGRKPPKRPVSFIGRTSNRQPHDMSFVRIPTGSDGEFT